MEPAPAPLRRRPSQLPPLFTLPRLLSPAERLPHDVLRLLLSYLPDFKDKTTFSGICKNWRIVAIQLHNFNKAQLGARVEILIKASHQNPISSTDEMLVEKTRAYLDAKEAQFDKIVTPPQQTKAFHNTLEKIQNTYTSTGHQLNHVPQMYYPILLQGCIEKVINGWMEGHSWRLERLSQLNIYPDGATPYEIEGVKNCLRPILLPHVNKWIFDKKSKWDPDKGVCEIATDWVTFAPVFTHSLFASILEVITRSNHLKHLVLNHAVKGVSHSNLMDLLNKELPHCHHLTTLTFSNGSDNQNRMVTDWLGQGGLRDLRHTLVGLPHLDKLVFDNLKIRMDVQNAQDLAEIITARSHDKKCSNIEDLKIDHGCITLEAAIALLVALKDYKDPINITFGAFLISDQGAFPDWAQILPYYDINLNLHIMFKHNSRSTCIIYDEKATLPGLGILGLGLLTVSHDLQSHTTKPKSFSKKERLEKPTKKTQ